MLLIDLFCPGLSSDGQRMRKRVGTEAITFAHSKLAFMNNYHDTREKVVDFMVTEGN